MRLYYIRKYVSERLTYDSEASEVPESTYTVLCKNTGTSAVNACCITQVIRDLCLLDGIPCFRVFGDDWESGEGYEMVMVYDGGQWWFSCSKNKDVTPSYSSGATCEIQGKGDYYDTVTRYFKILQRDISDMDVSIDVPISDYTVSYSGFNRVGTGVIVIKGRYNCTGTIRKTCELKPMKLTNDEFEVVLSQTSYTYTYTGAERKPGVTVRWLREDKTLWRNLSLSDYDITYVNNVEEGKAKVYIDGRGTFTGRLTAEFSIKKQSDNDTEPGDPNPPSEITPSPKPSTGGNTSQAQTVVSPDKKPTEKPSVQQNDKGVSALPKVKKPGKPSIKRLKNKKKKKVTLILSKKISGAKGYQVAFATKSTMKGQKKKFFKETSVTIKGLKKKKTYYFRVRAYKIVKGVKVYGKWGNIKRIKVRK